MKKIVGLVLVFLILGVGFAFAQDDDDGENIDLTFNEGMKIPHELVGKWKLSAIGSAVYVTFTEESKMILESGFFGGIIQDVELKDNTLFVSNPSTGSSGNVRISISDNSIRLSRNRGTTGLALGSYRKQ